jgi:hypothetical protein
VDVLFLEMECIRKSTYTKNLTLSIGTYKSPDFELADVLIVHLTESYELELK